MQYKRIVSFFQIQNTNLLALCVSCGVLHGTVMRWPNYLVENNWHVHTYMYMTCPKFVSQICEKLKEAQEKG